MLELPMRNLTEGKKYFQYSFFFWIYPSQPKTKTILHKLILLSATWPFDFTVRCLLPLKCIIACSVVFSYLRPVNNVHTNPLSKETLLKNHTECSQRKSILSHSTIYSSHI